MKFRSISVPVNATQLDENTVYDWNKNKEDGKYWVINSDGEKIYTEGLICFNYGDWFVQFPNKEYHIVSDANFKLRFEQVEKFSKKELSYAARLAATSDCE